MTTNNDSFTIEQIVDTISARYLTMTTEGHKAFCEAGKLLVLPKDSMLVQEGEINKNVFFIASGSIKSYYHKNGREVVDWFGFENEFLNSFYPCFLNQPSKHSIKTLERTVLFEIHSDSINDIGKKHIEILKLQNIVRAAVVALLQRKMKSIHFESGLMRYESLTAFRPNVFQRAPLTDIASYLGMTLENLSRIRGQLSKKPTC